MVRYGDAESTHMMCEGQMVRYGASESAHMMLMTRWLGLVMPRFPHDVDARWLGTVPPRVPT